MGGRGNGWGLINEGEGGCRWWLGLLEAWCGRRKRGETLADRTNGLRC